MEVKEVEAPYNERPLSYKEWALNIFLASIPLIGFILLLVWAIGDTGNVHRKEWAKGMLLIMLIVIVLTVIFYVIIGGLAVMSGVFN